eukprot:9089679-Alexandrium_andersonii.AAC.1
MGPSALCRPGPCGRRRLRPSPRRPERAPDAAPPRTLPATNARSEGSDGCCTILCTRNGTCMIAEERRSSVARPTGD